MLQKSKRNKKIMVVLYLIIPLIIYVFSVFVPLITAMFDSFFDWKGGPQKTFNGIQNYINLFHDDVFWQSFWHNIFLVVFCLIGQIGIAFILVLMIDSKLVKLKAAVCVGFIWKMIYDYNRGILNWLLEKIGHGDAAKVWLNEPGLVMLLVSIPLVWQYIGYYMVILLSGISSIDKEIFESAEIDGANAVQRAIYIVFPLIKNTLLICITLCIAGNMKAFDNIYVMTSGGPGTSSMVMALYGYTVSFKQNNMGYGCCVSVAIFVLSLLVIGAAQKLFNWLLKDKGVD